MTTTPPPHRGAARQIYGSASLRAPGSPMVSNQHGQNKHKVVPSPAPNPKGIVLSQPYIPPHSVPYPGHYPVFIGRDGRAYTFTNMRNSGPIRVPPMDYRLLTGKGFSNQDLKNIDRFLPAVQRAKGPEITPGVKVSGENGEFITACKNACRKGEFMCVRTCVCLKREQR